jgi:hypothetical protein
MKIIPTHSKDGLLLSKWGRIHIYAEEELKTLYRELLFSQVQDEKELIKRLESIIHIIKELTKPEK